MNICMDIRMQDACPVKFDSQEYHDKRTSRQMNRVVMPDVCGICIVIHIAQ